MIRSSRSDVRNPVLKLAACEKFRALPPDARDALVDLLTDLRRDAADQAQKCWKRHKPPMAAYWKAVAVYAGHIARAAKAEGRS